MRSLRNRILALGAALLAVGVARAADVSPVTALDADSFSLTVKATNKFTRNTTKLKEQAMEVAARYCADAGKKLKVVSVDEDKSQYLVGPYAKVTLTFKALSPDNPELAGVTGAIEDHPKPPPPMTADLLTSELTKLDELRKKGLLTDEEFTAAKKKLLERL